MRKVAIAIAILVFVSVISQYPAVGDKGRLEVWVWQEEGNNKNNGSKEYPVASIKEGINKVAENGTVHVVGGKDTEIVVFEENVEIKKSLTLQAVEGENVTIRGTGNVIEIIERRNQLGKIKKVNIIGFTIETKKKKGSCGIYLHTEKTELTITKCTIKGFKDNPNVSAEYGIYIHSKHEGSVKMTECKISENENGIRLAESTTATIEKCRINKNDKHGVWMSEGAKANITCTVISYNKNGVYVTERVELLSIANSKIEENFKSEANEGTGVLIKSTGEGAQITINYCIIKNNGKEKKYGVNNEKKGIDVDATANWWGDASGPGGNVYDPTTRKLANGEGDHISSHVKFDKPLEKEPECECIKVSGVNSTYIYRCGGMNLDVRVVGDDYSNVIYEIEILPETQNPPWDSVQGIEAPEGWDFENFDYGVRFYTETNPLQKCQRVTFRIDVEAKIISLFIRIYVKDKAHGTIGIVTSVKRWFRYYPV